MIKYVTLLVDEFSRGNIFLVQGFHLQFTFVCGEEWESCKAIILTWLGQIRSQRGVQKNSIFDYGLLCLLLDCSSGRWMQAGMVYLGGVGRTGCHLMYFDPLTTFMRENWWSIFRSAESLRIGQQIPASWGFLSFMKMNLPKNWSIFVPKILQKWA